MRRRIFLFSALLADLAVIAVSVLVAVTVFDNSFDAIKREVVAEAVYIETGYLIAGDAYLDGLEHSTGHRVTIITPDGNVRYDSAGDPGRMDNHFERPEVQDALINGKGETTRYSDTLSEQTFYYAIRLSDGSVLRMSSTVDSILTSFGSILAMVVLIAVSFVLLSSVIASVITQRIIKPINNINLDHPDDNMIYDEMVPLFKRIKEQRTKIDSQIEELDRGRREFAAITDNMNEGFLVLDKTGRILSYNKSAMNLFGTRPDIILGENVLALNRSQEIRELIQAVLNGKANEEIIEIGGRQCQLFANPVMDSDAVSGAVVLIMDITEKQEREKLRREFTANVSHELKTPLTSISGYSEIISNGIAKEEDAQRFAGLIHTEAQRMITLIEDIMMLSRLDEGVSEVTSELVDLYELVREETDRFRPLASADGITISLDRHCERAIIRGILPVINEMIYNLLDNAVKYNKHGGRVNVIVATENNEAVLTVADTGIGIAEGEQERIFERFYRVDKSRSDAIAGTGLGLAIVKHGAALHDAKIELFSDIASGTVIKLRFREASADPALRTTDTAITSTDTELT